MGLTITTFPVMHRGRKIATIGLREVKFKDFDYWIRQVAKSGKSPDEMTPLLVSMVAKELNGAPVGDEGITDVRVFNFAARQIGEMMVAGDGAVEAARATLDEVAGAVSFTAPSGATVRFKVPTVAEYQAARASDPGAGVYMLDLLRKCLVDANGARADVFALDLADAMVYRDIFTREIAGDESDYAASVAGASTVAG